MAVGADGTGLLAQPPAPPTHAVEWPVTRPLGMLEPLRPPTLAFAFAVLADTDLHEQQADQNYQTAPDQGQREDLAWLALHRAAADGAGDHKQPHRTMGDDPRGPSQRSRSARTIALERSATSTAPRLRTSLAHSSFAR